MFKHPMMILQKLESMHLKFGNMGKAKIEVNQIIGNLMFNNT